MTEKSTRGVLCRKPPHHPRNQTKSHLETRAESKGNGIGGSDGKARGGASCSLVEATRETLEWDSSFGTGGRGGPY